MAYYLDGKPLKLEAAEPTVRTVFAVVVIIHKT